ncbi:isocitrate lyase/phosphoenolpyruvate mutase family protein [Peterkaempfera sp. SMS 1(5)a]|uniref:isocitrate lyase/PEP mutase family protein n=1 Tax=Peterkaempfera podocarpi TaxID=3232308 RepID=UPI003670815C
MVSAAALRALHHRTGQPLVLPNVWDAVSARSFEAAGFPALATASAAVSAVLGHADGQGTPVEVMLDAVARITRSVAVPVTADIEAGYGLPAGELAERLLAAGAAGCNLEDSDPGSRTLADPGAHADRLAELRAAAGPDLVVNARIDVYLGGRFPGGPEEALAEAAARAERYLAAGADCVYPIAAPEADLAALAKRLEAPVNALCAQPTRAALDRLASLGVARITFGDGLLTEATARLDTLAAGLAADAAALHGLG